MRFSNIPGLINQNRASALGNLALLAGYPVYKSVKNQLINRAARGIVNSALPSTYSSRYNNMPYRRRKSYSRRPYRRRGYSKRRRYSKRGRVARKVRKVRPFMSSTQTGRQYKTIETHQTNSNPVRVSLNAKELILIPRAAAAVDLDARQRDVVYIKGVLCRWFFSLDHVAGTPSSADYKGITFCWAIVVPKNGLAPSDTGFLRGWDSTRAIDLNSAKSYMETCHNPINTDEYHVLKRGRHKMASPQAYNQQGQSRKFMHEKKLFLKLNTTVNFDAGTTSIQGARPWFVYWYDVNGRQAGGTDDVAGTKNFKFESYVWFKDIC